MMLQLYVRYVLGVGETKRETVVGRTVGTNSTKTMFIMRFRVNSTRLYSYTCVELTRVTS